MRGATIPARDAATPVRPPLSIHRTPRFMNSIVYIVGLIVIVLAILSFLGLR